MADDKKNIEDDEEEEDLGPDERPGGDKPEATINTNNDAKDDCSDLTDNNHETDEHSPKSFPQKVCWMLNLWDLDNFLPMKVDCFLFRTWKRLVQDGLVDSAATSEEHGEREFPSRFTQ